MSVAAAPQDTAHDHEVAQRYEQALVALLRRQLEGLSQPVTALHYACANDYASLELIGDLPQGSRVVAISENRRRINALHRKRREHPELELYPRKETLTRLPFASGAFDLVFSSLTLEQLRPPQPHLTQALRVLRPDGLFLMATPLRQCCFELVTRFGELLGKVLPEEAFRPLLADRGLLIDVEEWLEMLERAGLSEVEVWREQTEIELRPPLSRDPVFANILLPLWVGDDMTTQLELLELLDAHVHEPVRLPQHLGALRGRATRTTPELQHA